MAMATKAEEGAALDPHFKPTGYSRQRRTPPCLSEEVVARIPGHVTSRHPAVLPPHKEISPWIPVATSTT